MTKLSIKRQVGKWVVLYTIYHDQEELARFVNRYEAEAFVQSWELAERECES